MTPKLCTACGKPIDERDKMDLHRGYHLRCAPKPRDHKGIERDPSEPVDNDYAEEETR